MAVVEAPNTLAAAGAPNILLVVVVGVPGAFEGCPNTGGVDAGVPNENGVEVVLAPKGLGFTSVEVVAFALPNTFDFCSEFEVEPPPNMFPPPPKGLVVV